MVYVITGGPGFGKTVLIEKLRKLGYVAGMETARQIIAGQLDSGGILLPWIDARGFEKRVMDERIGFLRQAENQPVAFSDRGLPDQAAYTYYKGKDISETLKSALKNYRYAKIVFVTPPWRGIYQNDRIRTETFEEAVKIHYFILKAYLDYGYELIDLPLVSPEERIKFILQSI